MDTVTLRKEDYTAFSGLRGCMNVFPEQLDEDTPVLDVLHRGEDSMRSILDQIQMHRQVSLHTVVTNLHVSLSDVSVPVDISWYEIPEESSKMNRGLIETEVAGTSNRCCDLCAQQNGFTKLLLHIKRL